MIVMMIPITVRESPIAVISTSLDDKIAPKVIRNKATHYTSDYYRPMKIL
jgi:hypothetical protein